MSNTKVPRESAPYPAAALSAIAALMIAQYYRLSTGGRTQMRRFTRLPVRFPRSENHCNMVALYAVWYNLVKQHKTPKGPSPA